MIILAQKQDYYVKKHDYSCSNTRTLLVKDTIIISGRTIIISGCMKIKSGCIESNAKTCTRIVAIMIKTTIIMK